MDDLVTCFAVVNLCSWGGVEQLGGGFPVVSDTL